MRSNEVHRPASKGKRFIILHAMTKEGVLTERDENGEPEEVSNDMKEEAPNTELVFPDLKMRED